MGTAQIRQVDRALSAGAKAQQAGAPLSDNPYTTDRDLRYAWAYGYMESERLTHPELYLRQAPAPPVEIRRTDGKFTVGIRHRVSLVIDRWMEKGRKVEPEKEIELESHDFHGGSTFPADIQLDPEQSNELAAALDEGFTLRVTIHKRTEIA